MSDHICPEPGCGMEMVWATHPSPFFVAELVCPRNADAHALCAKLAESEAKVKKLKELETKVLVYFRRVDDPSIGWLGRSPSTPEHFQCERCGEEHLDSSLIPHTPDCSAAALLRLLLHRPANDLFGAMGLPDLPPFPSIESQEARKKGAEHGEV